MPEVLRVVPRLLERAQDECRERLAPAARLPDVGRDLLGDRTGQVGRLLRRHALGHRRRRHPELDQLREQAFDRLRIRPLVHAVERLTAAPRQERADELVREHHQLLDEHVRMRLALEPRVRDATFTVEAERDLGRLHLQGAAREALRPERLCQLVVQIERLEDRRRRLATLCLAVRQSCVRANHRAIELRVARRRDLHRHTKTILVRTQRAEIVGELVRQHRRNPSRDVRRERAPRRAVVERRAGTDEPRDVGDVHPRADAVWLASKRQRVVEVLRGVGVDRVGEQLAKVDAVRDVDRPELVLFERLPVAAFDEQRLEHVLDVVGATEVLLDVRTPAAGAHDGKVAALEVAGALQIESQRERRA